MIKIGILGAAKIAPIGIIEPARKRDDCLIQAVACRDYSRGDTFAKLHNIPVLETSYEKLIARNDIDLIYNALPPSRHADLSILALEAGKPVLCEKPFARNANEARQMVDASDRTGVPLVEALHYRHHPAFQKMLNTIASGKIGRVVGMSAIFVAPVPFVTGDVRHTYSIGGGSLMDMGCYPIHWARTIMGSEPTIKTASCVVNRENIDETTTAELLFQDGVVSRIECSMNENRPFQAELTVYGDKGALHFENPLSPHKGYKVSIAVNDKVEENRGMGRITYDLQIDYMIDVITSRSSVTLEAQDSINNMAVIDSIYQKANLPLR